MNFADDKLAPCFACGGLFTTTEGSTHEYMLSSPGCWAAYGSLLAREYESADLYDAVHRLTVDAYALQHPGDPTQRRAVQSVWVHYAALHLTLDKQPAALVRTKMRELIKLDLPQLPEPPEQFALTHADVLAAPVNQHGPCVNEWARAAFEAWSDLREPTARLLQAVY